MIAFEIIALISAVAHSIIELTSREERAKDKILGLLIAQKIVSVDGHEVGAFAVWKSSSSKSTSTSKLLILIACALNALEIGLNSARYGKIAWLLRNFT